MVGEELTTETPPPNGDNKVTELFLLVCLGVSASLHLPSHSLRFGDAGQWQAVPGKDTKVTKEKRT
jgi:hypothetical protein